MAGGFAGGGSGAIVFVVFIPIALLAAAIGLWSAISRSGADDRGASRAYRAFGIGFRWAIGLGAVLSLVAAPLLGPLGWTNDWIQAYLTVAALILAGAIVVGALSSAAVWLGAGRTPRTGR